MATDALGWIETLGKERDIELRRISAGAGAGLLVAFGDAKAAFELDLSADAPGDGEFVLFVADPALDWRSALEREGVAPDAVWLGVVADASAPIGLARVPAASKLRAAGAPARPEGPDNLKRREKWFRESFGDPD